MDIKVGQQWVLKDEEQCREALPGNFTDSMTRFCGGTVTIIRVFPQEELGDYEKHNGYNGFLVEQNMYYWNTGCLDRMVSDAPATITPPPCADRVDVPKDMFFTEQGRVVRVGELWWLKKWDEISYEAKMVTTDDMRLLLGSLQMITFLSDDGFEVHADNSGPDGEKFHFPYECLLERVTNALVGAAPENTHTPLDRGVPIRKLSGIYEVQSCDGAATVRLVVDYADGTFRIESKAKDGKFLFDTKQQGNPDLWESVLEAIRTAVSYGKKVVSDVRE